jgi:hypothetical protein
MTVAVEISAGTKKNIVIEKILTVLVSLFAASIYFSKTGLSVFGIAAILLMVYWRFVPGYIQKPAVPKAVIICTVLLVFNLFLSALMSENRQWVLSELGKYRHLLFGALLYAAPLSKKNRGICLVVFLISASLDGLTGVLQYFDIQYWQSGMVVWTKEYLNTRPLGNSSDSILYAADLALAFSGAVALFFIDHDTYKSKKEKAFLSITAFSMFMGIIASGSRGVWVAVLPACLIALYCYNRKSALILLALFSLVMATLFTFSTNIAHRAATIATSAYTENSVESTGNRLELWKASLLMFKQSPLIGIGAGDFQPTVKKFIAEKKMKEVAATNTAHSIYFQVLATRGVIGLGILLIFFTSLVLWGRKEMKNGNKIGGQIILMSALLAILGGLTENHLEVHRYLATFGFTIGLLGPYGVQERNRPLV